MDRRLSEKTFQIESRYCLMNGQWRGFFLVHHPDARGHTKGGGDGGQHSDENVQDFAPELFVFHSLFSF